MLNRRHPSRRKYDFKLETGCMRALFRLHYGGGELLSGMGARGVNTLKFLVSINRSLKKQNRNSSTWFLRSIVVNRATIVMDTDYHTISSLQRYLALVGAER